MIRRASQFPALTIALLLAGCGGAAKDAPVEGAGATTTVTQATLDALPLVSLSEGGRVCLGDGKSHCPLQAAIANWVAIDRFVVWEPGRQVAAFRIGDTTGIVVGGFGEGAGRYSNPAAVAGTASGGMLVIDADSGRMLRYDPQGKFIDSKPLPPLTNGMFAWGFGGNLPVLQEISAVNDTAPAILQLKVLNAAGDTAGRVALKHPLPWLHLRGDVVSSALPLFPTQPVYAFGEDGALVWSSAERFWFQRINPAGKVEWTLSSDITGPPIDSATISTRRKTIVGAGVPAVDIDSMVARTPATYSAVSGILLSRDGRAVVAQALVPSSDSLRFVTISKSGVPTARFTLGKQVHPLLLSGDSLLVQRPGDGELLEVRWLILPKGK
ncbi:MAG: hypothetical protein ABIZ70_05330 [Gemmatimonadales bacterium]